MVKRPLTEGVGSACGASGIEMESPGGFLWPPLGLDPLEPLPPELTPLGRVRL